MTFPSTISDSTLNPQRPCTCPRTTRVMSSGAALGARFGEGFKAVLVLVNRARRKLEEDRSAELFGDAKRGQADFHLDRRD